MAVRKPLVQVGGIAQELTSPADTLDAFARGDFPFSCVGAPLVGDTPRVRVNRAIQLTEVSAVLSGSDSPTVSFQIRYASTGNGTPTNVFSANQSITSQAGVSLTNFATTPMIVPAGTWLWLEITAVFGTVTNFSATIFFQ
jgi:hypothetical protein